MNQSLKKLIDDCNDEISDIAVKISSLPKLDSNIKYLTKYALIKTCGTLEYVYRSIVADFLDLTASSQVQSYIDKKIRSGSMGVKYESMCNLLCAFDTNWEKEFKQKINALPNKQRLIDAAKSLAENRNSFAHGKEPLATFSEICDYYNDTLQLVWLLDSVVK